MKPSDLQFKKSSFSPKSGHYCVGVAKYKGNIVITNTNNERGIITYTKEEWEAFVKGVKNNEFRYEDIIEQSGDIRT